MGPTRLHYQGNTCDQCMDTYYRYNNDSCDTCIAGRYGPTCSSNCTDTCENATCDMNIGQCTACSEGYYWNETGCSKCSLQCSTCLSEDLCLTCNAGYRLVSNQCVGCSSDCKDKPCDADGACANGCQYFDRFGPYCDKICSTTYPFCSKCNMTDCEVCSSGYFLRSAECTQCSGNCKGGTECRSSDGACLEGCKPTWTGAQCLDKCPRNCLPCSQFETCSTCKAGFYGIKCKSKCGICSATTTGSLCSRDGGVCVSGCTIGSWGPRCDRTCSNGCLSSICFQDNGRCYRCKPDMYGTQCDQACSEACVHPGNSSNVCRQSDGVCVFGCSPGIESGECSRDANTQTSTNTDSSRGSMSAITWILSGVVAIAVTIIIAAVIIIIRLRKYKKRVNRQKTPTGSTVLGETTNLGMTSMHS